MVVNWKKFAIIYLERVYMKKFLKKILCFMVLLLIPIVCVKGESQDYFVNSGSVNKEEINHSVFVANESFNYSDTVKGIAFIAGNSVNVDSITEYGFYAGNVLNVTGTINNDLFVAGNSVSIDKDTVIGRDAYVVGNAINLNSNIEGNLFIAGNSITLNNVTINGDVNLAADSIKIVGNVNIIGTLKYNEDCKIENDSSLVTGNKESYQEEKFNNNEKNVFVDTLTSIAMLLVLGFVLNLAFSKVYNKVNKDNNVKSIIMDMLYGLLTLVVA